MELVLGAIASGGLVGASDQYMCLLLVSLAARLKWITLTPALSFMESWWFIAIVVVFWLVTVAPAYASMLSPGVLHAVNTVVNFLSGFVVPVSAALIALASAGVIASMNPDMQHVLETLRIFTTEGHIGGTGVALAGVSGLTALTLTASKGLAKPALSVSTGTAGTAAAPIYATIENVASLALMGLVYVLSRLDPWLIVALLVVVTIFVVGMLGYAIYQLWRLKKGIGKVAYLVQTYPRAGLAVTLEFFVWGAGWLIWETWGRGVIMLAAWAGWVALLVVAPPVVGVLFAFFPPLIPFAMFMAYALLVIVFAGVGLNSAQALLKLVEKKVPETKPVVPEEAVA